jgi:hypothetical protein
MLNRAQAEKADGKNVEDDFSLMVERRSRISGARQAMYATRTCLFRLDAHLGKQVNQSTRSA